MTRKGWYAIKPKQPTNILNGAPQEIKLKIKRKSTIEILPS